MILDMDAVTMRITHLLVVLALLLESHVKREVKKITPEANSGVICLSLREATSYQK